MSMWSFCVHWKEIVRKCAHTLHCMTCHMLLLCRSHSKPIVLDDVYRSAAMSCWSSNPDLDPYNTFSHVDILMILNYVFRSAAFCIIGHISFSVSKIPCMRPATFALHSAWVGAMFSCTFYSIPAFCWSCSVFFFFAWLDTHPPW